MVDSIGWQHIECRIEFDGNGFFWGENVTQIDCDALKAEIKAILKCHHHEHLLLHLPSFQISLWWSLFRSHLNLLKQSNNNNNIHAKKTNDPHAEHFGQQPNSSSDCEISFVGQFVGSCKCSTETIDEMCQPKNSFLTFDWFLVVILLFPSCFSSPFFFSFVFSFNLSCVNWYGGDWNNDEKKLPMNESKHLKST